MRKGFSDRELTPLQMNQDTRTKNTTGARTHWKNEISKSQSNFFNGILARTNFKQLPQLDMRT